MIRSRKMVLSMIVLFGILLLIHYSQIARPFENAIIRLIQPTQAFLYAVENQTTDESTSTVQSLQDQNENLIIENTHLKTLLDQVELLEEQMTFLNDRSFQAVTAKVTSRTTESLSQRIVINKGSVHGIKKGFPVIIDSGVLIGTVEDVHDYSSEVLLLTSFDSRVSAFVQNDMQSPGIVQGEHNLSLLIDFVPQLDSIAVSDVVLTSGTDPLIPSDLLIGTLQEIRNAPGSLFQQAVMTPFFEPEQVTIVSVLVP